MKKNYLVKLILVFVVAIVGALTFAGCNTEQNSPEYTLIYKAETGGQISGEAEQVIGEYSDGTGVTAIPDEGYKFEKWSDGITTPERQDKNVTKDITVTAIFTKLNYSVTYNTDGNGTIKGEANQTVAYGENGTEVEAIPNEGYKFVNWSDGIATKSRTETGVKANITLTANFEKLFYTVKYNISGNGMIEGETNQTINYGGNCTTVKAIPADGYRFVKWSDGNAKQERTDINIESDIIITAIFERLTYVVLYETDGNGTIKGETNQTVAYGDNTTTITAIPNAGYAFVQWSDGKVEPTRQETDVKESLTLTAIFEKLLYTVKYSAYENGTIEGETNQIIAYGESAATVRAVPNEGYRFVRWSDGVTKAERTDVEINKDINVKAEFTVLNFVVNYGIEGNGTIEGEAVQIVLYGEDCSEVKAVPNEGYAFVRWSDGNTNPTRQDTNVKEHIALTAIFDNTFTVTYMTEGNGTIEGEANQTVKYGRWNSTVKAVPDEGYRFVKWSDGYTNPVRAELVYENISVTAIFEPLILKVSYSIRGGYFLVDGERFDIVYSEYVNYGENTTKKVKIVPYDYRQSFIMWSDGVETEERQDLNVTEDIYVSVVFGVKLTYSVDGNKGGKLKGNCSQILEVGGDAEKITAVPENGYIFGGWSDLSFDLERHEKKVIATFEYVAYFELIEKTFKYDYGDVFGTPLQDKVVLNRYQLKDVNFVVPELQGYTFCGWYVDKEFKTMLANESGKLMLGFYTFNLETDTIYARWKPNNDDKLTYKILMVHIDSLQASPYSSKLAKKIDVDYKMTVLEKRILALNTTRFQATLNSWFSEIETDFQIDMYFTTDLLKPDIAVAGEYFSVYANNIYEVENLIDVYGSVITVFGLRNWEYLSNATSGMAYSKYAALNIDAFFEQLLINNIPLQKIYEELIDEPDGFYMAELYTHEFTHTIEHHYKLGISTGMKTIVTYHDILDYANPFAELDNCMRTKRYLLCEFELDGELMGIPKDFWLTPAYWKEDWWYSNTQR